MVHSRREMSTVNSGRLYEGVGSAVRRPPLTARRGSGSPPSVVFALGLVMLLVLVTVYGLVLYALHPN
jgi:hypothetical protein